MENINIALITLVLLGISACTTDTSSYISETVGDQTFSLNAIRDASFRLGPAAGLDTNIGLLRKAKQQGNPDEVLKLLSRKPNGTDLNYFYLAWAAEQLGFKDAAFEYYSLAKKLYLFSRTVNIGEPGYITSHYVSYCGDYEFKYGDESKACPSNMYGEIERAIARNSPF
jgi:hypothetical protein